MTRPTGLKGRLPQRAVGDRFNIQWAHQYLASPLPSPTYPIDVTGGITDFGMMGNDNYGDCGAAGEVHGEMTTAVAAGVTGPAPDSPLALNRYTTYVGSTTPPGPGVVLADYLLWLYKNGYIKAFAPVDHTNKAQMDALMQVGFFLYVGVNLTDRDEQDFGAQPPVTWGSQGGTPQPNPNNGHCIIKVKADGHGTDGWVTWGAVQLSTEEWTKAVVQEAWLVVTTEEQLAKFTPALLADINALGGTGGSQPPAPSPFPRPPVHLSLWDRILRFLRSL